MQHLPGETKTKCHFYNCITRESITSEYIFDNYIIPLIQIPDNIRIPNGGGNRAGSNNCNLNGIRLSKVFDLEIISSLGGNKTVKDNAGMSSGLKFDSVFDIGVISNRSRALKIKNNVGNVKMSLTSLFNEKYRDSFEIDIDNKILYRTVKTYTGYPSSIIDIPYKISNQNIAEKHPTTKPVEVLEYLIKKYTKEGDTVLDMTMGSGSTGVACKNLDRSFIRNRNR